MRVVLAEDSVLLREGIARILEGRIEVVGQAGDAGGPAAQGARAQAGRRDHRHPHAAQPHRRGLRAAHEIRGELPEIGVLVLSQYVEEGYALDLLADNAAGLGYLLKDRVGDVDAFLDAVRRVSEGGSALDPEVVSQLMGRKRRDDPLDELTPRARGARADGGGALQPRDRRSARRDRARRREARDEHLFEARPGEHPRGPPQVLAVLAYLRT